MAERGALRLRAQRGDINVFTPDKVSEVESEKPIQGG